MSTDNSWNYACELTKDDSRFQIRKNHEKCWALKNVVKVAREFEHREDVVIAVLDADDALCNENTTSSI